MTRSICTKEDAMKGRKVFAGMETYRLVGCVAEEEVVLVQLHLKEDKLTGV